MAVIPVFPLINNSTGQYEMPVNYQTPEGLVAAGFYPQKSSTALTAPTVTTGIEYDSGNAYLVVKTEGTKISFQMVGNEYAFIDSNGVNAGKLDAPSGVALAIGGTNATGITIGKSGISVGVGGTPNLSGAFQVIGSWQSISRTENDSTSRTCVRFVRGTGAGADASINTENTGVNDVSALSFYLNGSERARLDSVGLKSASLDVVSGALTIGGTNATGITVGKAGITVNVPGTLQMAGSTVWTAATFDPSTKAAIGQTMYIGTTGVAINRASANLALTGISSITLPGATSGTCQLIPTAVAGTGTVLTLPATTGTVALTSQLPTVNDAGLTLQIGTAGATNTSITIGTGTGFTANDASPTTYDIKVGPGITALVGQMTGATSGLLKKTAQDTLTIDTSTYLTTASGTAYDSARLGGTAAASYALLTNTMYIGTTGVALNRTSGALTLSGITLASPVFTGDASFSTVGAAVKATGSNSSLNIKGNRSAADTGTDVVINSSVTRTQGSILEVDNNGGLQFNVNYAGYVGLQGNLTFWGSAPQISATNMYSTLKLLGYQDPTVWASDVAISSSVTRSAGYLLEVQNAGTGLLTVAYDGSLQLYPLSISSDQDSPSVIFSGYLTEGGERREGQIWVSSQGELSFQDYDNGATTLSQLVNPYQSLDVSASYYASVSESCTSGNKRINFGNQLWDTNSAVTTGTDAWKFTASVAGVYHVDASVHMQGGAGSIVPCSAAIWKCPSGGSPAVYKQGNRINFHSDGYAEVLVNGDVVLNVGDYIYITMNSSSVGSTYVASSATTWCNVRLGHPVVSTPVTGAVTGSIAASYWTATQQTCSASAWTPVNFEVQQWDTNSAVTNPSTNWRFVAPVAGVYHVDASALVSGTSGNYVQIAIFKGVGQGTLSYHRAGNYIAYTPLNYVRPQISADILLNAGDSIGIQVQSYGVTGTIPSGDPGGCYCNVSLQGTVGNLANAATGIISAGYTVTAAQNIPNASLGTNAIVNFDAKTWDSNNAVTTGSGWKFTAPTTGNYHVTATVDIAVPTSTAGDALLTIFKNGTEYRRGSRISPSATGWTGAATWTVEVSATVALSVGDYIDIRCYQSTGGSVRAVDTTTNLNHISIDYLGGNVIGGNGNFYLFKAGDTATGRINLVTPSNDWSLVTAGTGWTLSSTRLRKSAEGVVFFSTYASYAGGGSTLALTLPAGYRSGTGSIAVPLACILYSNAAVGPGTYTSGSGVYVASSTTQAYWISGSWVAEA